MNNSQMKKLSIFWILCAGCIFLFACAGSKDSVKPSMHMGKKLSIIATIEAIDYESRTVTIKGPRGNTIDIKVGEDAPNFDQLEVGDMVDINYYASVAVRLQKATGMPSVMSEKEKNRARKGQKPQGVLTEVIEIRAIVEKIDYENRTVELRGPEGNLIPLEVDADVKNFENVKQGDEVVATFTEAVSYTVRPAQE